MVSHTHSSCPSRNFRCDRSHHDLLTPVEPSSTMWGSISSLYWVWWSLLNKYCQHSCQATYWVSPMAQVLVKPHACRWESKCGSCLMSLPVTEREAQSTSKQSNRFNHKRENWISESLSHCPKATHKYKWGLLLRSGAPSGAEPNWLQL